MIWPFVCVCVCAHVLAANSKAERPPSLSLYPSGEGMVRGGLGGARMMPGKDIWQVSELGQSTLSSAYQVGQTAAASFLHKHNCQRWRGGGAWVTNWSAFLPPLATAAWGVVAGDGQPYRWASGKRHIPTTTLYACFCHFVFFVFFPVPTQASPGSFLMAVLQTLWSFICDHGASASCTRVLVLSVLMLLDVFVDCRGVMQNTCLAQLPVLNFLSFMP